RSRSVAVIANLSPEASKRKFERMGIVVLRSTTPCVAVSSFNRSDLVMVISIVAPASLPAEEGIFWPPNNIFYVTSKSQIHTAVTADACGKVGISDKSQSCELFPFVGPRVILIRSHRSTADSRGNLGWFGGILHSLHSPSTGIGR